MILAAPPAPHLPLTHSPVSHQHPESHTESSPASKDFVVWRGGEKPQAWDRSCAALDVVTQEYRLLSCTTALYAYCVREPGSPTEDPAGPGADLSDVELRVEGDRKAGPDGWFSLTRDQFYNLTLTCTAYSRTTGAPLLPQPPVFWVKDLVYSGHCVGSLLPSTLHDSSKSLATADPLPGDPHSLLQGTYWCEAWEPAGAARRASNKVLLTLNDTVIFILRARRMETPQEVQTETEAKAMLRNAFSRKIAKISSHPLDLVSASKESRRGALLATYTFHLHLPRASIRANWTSVEEYLQLHVNFLDKSFTDSGYERSSRVSFPTLCLKHTSSGRDAGDPHLKWPLTEAGTDVHPFNTRCEVPPGLLIPGRCAWNYTHGARIEFDPEPCEWRSVCPRGYTAMGPRRRKYCVAVWPAAPWEEGFRAVHNTSREMSLLDDHRFLNMKAKGVYEQVRRLVEARTGTSVVWLPDRRLRAHAPLQHLGPLPRPNNIMGYRLNQYNISWAAGQPRSHQECLALDLAARELLTHPCGTRLPFPVLISAPFLQPSVSAWPPLWEESAQSSEWLAPALKGPDELHFKLFTSVGNLTWEKAQNFCRDREADLPTPNVGFLDWVYRQYLHKCDVGGVWMATRWVSERMVYSGPQHTINWAADTDYSQPFGELTPTGWRLRGGHTLGAVLCQKRLTSNTNLRLELRPHASFPSQFLCVEVNPSMLLVRGGPNGIRCFVNGRNLSLQTSEDPGCTMRLNAGEPGHYQCVGWTLPPVTLTASNTLLHIPARTLTFLVTMLQENASYVPLSHDTTFMPPHELQGHSTICGEALLAALSVIDLKGSQQPTIRSYIYLPDPDGRLLHGVHLEYRLQEGSSLTEGRVLDTLESSLAPGKKLPPCTVQAILTTTGCVREETEDHGGQGVTPNGRLSWPATFGAREVVPEQLCVTLAGEPVTRKCVGDYMQGYSWGPAGNCTGRPSAVTSSLWRASRAPRSSLGQAAAITANGSALQPVDIHLVAETFRALSEAPPPSLSLASLVAVLDNVLAADSDTFYPVQRKLHSSGILLRSFQELSFQVEVVGDGDEQGSRASGTWVSAESLSLGEGSSVVGYKSFRGKREETLLAGVTSSDLQDATAAIILPINLTKARMEPVVRMDTNSTLEHQVSVTFAVYRNEKLFQEIEGSRVELRTGLEAGLGAGPWANYSLNSEVIQANLRGPPVRNLRKPVKIYFKPLRAGTDIKCVFWDPWLHDGRGGWSTEGCWSGGQEGDHHLCLCNHLTCFAQLINYDQSSGFSGTHAIVLEAITVVGCCLSILALLLVFATFLLFQRWRRPLSNKILVSLCLADFCSLTVFLAGVNQTANRPLCRGVAVSLHYFILASFAWMLVEAVHQYLNFVKVVGTYIPRFMWKASVCAWGIPVLPILVVLVYDSSLYDHDGAREDGSQICWMSSEGFRLAFLPPLAATMTVNLVLYGLILHGVTCGRPSVPSTLPERALLMNQLRMAVCVFFLLGFTWMFGLLAVSEARLVFSYLFCIFNTLQGFFLFMFHVCRERGARRYWRDFLSVLRQESASSSPGNSANATPFGGRVRGASFHPCGGIVVLPAGTSHHPRHSAHTSLLSARTTSTLGASRGSFTR